jgi:hypothetical protein
VRLRKARGGLVAQMELEVAGDRMRQRRGSRARFGNVADSGLPAWSERKEQSMAESTESSARRGRHRGRRSTPGTAATALGQRGRRRAREGRWGEEWRGRPGEMDGGCLISSPHLLRCCGERWTAAVRAGCGGDDSGAGAVGRRPAGPAGPRGKPRYALPFSSFSVFLFLFNNRERR